MAEKKVAEKKMNYQQREGMSYVRVVPKFLQGGIHFSKQDILTVLSYPYSIE
jgi:hypothetical protein